MKKYTYYRYRHKDGRYRYTGETQDRYYAGGESAPTVVIEGPEQPSKRISVGGGSKTYFNNYDKVFGPS